MNCESPGVEPKTINQISITRALGSGGMGDVFEGFDQVLKRKVAVKIIKSKLLSTPNRRRRFLREAQILSQLEHPNICRVHNFFSHESQIEFMDVTVKYCALFFSLILCYCTPEFFFSPFSFVKGEACKQFLDNL